MSVSKLRKQKKVNCILIALSMCTAGQISAQSASHENQGAAVRQFKSINGEYKKGQFLDSLLNEKAVSMKSAQEAQDNTLPLVLETALTEESPIVVEKALKVIKHQNRKEFITQIINSYTGADARFGGYSERVKLAAISALGEIGGNSASRLFAEILAKENASVIAEQTLNAILNSRDASLSNNVLKFQFKMRKIIDNECAKATTR